MIVFIQAHVDDTRCGYALISVAAVAAAAVGTLCLFKSQAMLTQRLHPASITPQPWSTVTDTSIIQTLMTHLPF